MKVGSYRIGDKFWKASHRCYFVKIVHPDGRREDRRLDPNEDKAEEVRAGVITSARKEGHPSSDYCVKDLCFLFLDHSKANNAPGTYQYYCNFLKSFCSTIPANLRVRDFKLYHVQNWLKRKYPATGNTNTRHAAVACLKRVFNWAIHDMEYFDRNPLGKLKKPPKVARATCLSKDQWAEVLSKYSSDDPFYDFLYVMLNTGCRPQEVRIMEARHIDFETRKVCFADGEVPGKKGDREILLSEAVVVVLRKWALKNPEGPVLRNEDGNPWNKNAINSRFQRLKNGKKKIPFNVHAYVARHSVATEMLEAGASAGAVAAVLGHKDPTMVLKVYGKHIEQREKHLRECIEKATAKRVM